MTEQNDTSGTGNPADEPSAGVEDTADPGTSGADGGPSDGGATDTTDSGSSDAGGTTDGTDAGTTDGTDAGSGDSASTDGAATDAASSGDAATDGGDSASSGDGATDGADGSSSDASTAAADAGSSGDGTTDGADSSASGGAAGGDSGDAGASTAGASGGDSAAAGATSGGSADPGQPYLFVDLYSGDDGRLVGGHPAWAQLASTKGFVGAILKAWDGTQFNDGGWFGRNWPALRAAGAARYGTSWFRGAYLFLEFHQDGAAQADAYLRAVDAAGGWDVGDLLPIIDAEQGGVATPAVPATATTRARPARPAHPNRSATAQQVIDCVTACADRLRSQTGRRVLLYGRGAMRDLGINNRMGCDLVWNPSWTPHPVRSGLEAWTLEEMVLWQYCGDGTAAVANLPHTVAGFGSTVDLSVFVKGAQAPNLQMLRDNLLR